MHSSHNALASEPLYDLIYACQRGQRVAVVGSHTDDNPLRERLYVKQEEDNRVQEFFSKEYTEDGRLLILTGSAGDGKSALLAEGYECADESFPVGRVNMDATEARTRDGDYADRLTDFLQTVIDDIKSEDGPRSAIAINYGLAVDYFERRGAPEKFDIVWKALQESQGKPVHQSPDYNITVINLSHRRTYETHPDGLGEGLVRQLFDRFDPTEEESPFATAYERELDGCPAGDDCVLQYNLRQLTQTRVKDQLARLFAGWSVVTGSYLNPRTIIDNIASLLLPTDTEEFPDHDVCPVGAAIDRGEYNPTGSTLLWNRAFETLGTEGDSTASLIDPASRTSFETDQQALQWATGESIVNDELPNVPAVEFASSADRIRTVLRKQYLNDDAVETILENQSFNDFLAALTYFGQQSPPDNFESGAEAVLKSTRIALSSWTGHARDDGLVEFVDGMRSPEYRFLSRWNQPGFDTDESRTETHELAVPGRIKLMANAPENQDDHVPIPLSFETYRLMTQISRGYTPNATELDQSHAIRMLHSRLDDFTDKREQVIIEDRSGSRRIEIAKGDIQINVSSESLQ